MYVFIYIELLSMFYIQLICKKRWNVINMKTFLDILQIQRFYFYVFFFSLQNTLELRF